MYFIITNSSQGHFILTVDEEDATGGGLGIVSDSPSLNGSTLSFYDDFNVWNNFRNGERSRLRLHANRNATVCRDDWGAKQDWAKDCARWEEGFGAFKWEWEVSEGREVCAGASRGGWMLNPPRPPTTTTRTAALMAWVSVPSPPRILPSTWSPRGVTAYTV